MHNASGSALASAVRKKLVESPGANSEECCRPSLVPPRERKHTMRLGRIQLVETSHRGKKFMRKKAEEVFPPTFLSEGLFREACPEEPKLASGKKKPSCPLECHLVRNWRSSFFGE